MELIKAALRQITRKRGRTLLTIGGIAVGVMMVSSVTVVSAVGRDLVDRELDSMGVSGLSVMALTPDMLLSEQALDEIRSLPQVTTAMPLMLQLTGVSSPRGSMESVLCGIDAGAGQVISLSLQHGRMITKGDVAAANTVCMLDEAAAEKAFGRKNVVGKTVTVEFGNRSQALTVVGVTQTGSSLLQNVTSMIPGMVYLPYTTQQELTGRTEFDQIAVRTVDGDSTERVQQRIDRVLERLYETPSVFRTDDLAMQKDRLTRIVDVVAAVLTVLSGVSLVVSGFGIMTVMLSSVSERTREIGVKKAIGATQRRILAEFLTEAILLSVAGALVGLIPVAILLVILKASVSPFLFLALTGFAMVIGAAFGVYPAYRASKLPPVEALRCE
ncbi:MAG: ABC transporter permease [Clostridia bacterium]|nr:ABC transporter permease [Clostridia bacterium]